MKIYMELEAINIKIENEYIYIIQTMDFIYIGSGENANNKDRSETHLYELFYKIKKRRTINNEIV